MAAASALGPPRLRASSAVRSVSGMQHAYLQAPNASAEAALYVSMVDGTPQGGNSLMSVREDVRASVYTQITDVELECDGFLNYDRSNKFDAADTARPIQDVPALEETHARDVKDDTTASIDTRPAPTTWRSALFPSDWTPETRDAAGRFLHDFSYAGYKLGAAPPVGAEAAGISDVVALGADPTGATDATDVIQAAIDAVSAAGGGVVFFPAGLYRVDGALTVETSGVVLRGVAADTSRVFFTRDTEMDYLSHLTFRGTLETGAERPLVADAEPGDRIVRVADASDIAAGDDVEIGWVPLEGDGSARFYAPGGRPFRIGVTDDVCG